MGWVDVSQVTVYLGIEHSDHFGSETTYRKVMDTPFCPFKGARIQLWKYGPTGTVHEVYWGADGSVWVDLERFVVDPSPTMVPHTRYNPQLSRQLHAWYTESEDGVDLRLRIVEEGWT